MDSEKYPCPCGQRNLCIKTTKKEGVNHGRKYLACPDCHFFSFLDELRICECGNGYCRNIWVKNVKRWCCPLKISKSCGFSVPVTRLTLPTRPTTPSQECQPATPIQECQPSTTGSSQIATATSTEETLAESLHISLGVIQSLVKKLDLN